MLVGKQKFVGCDAMAEQAQEKKTYFVSYTGCDEEYAVQIESIVRVRLGATTIMQKYDFRPGQNFRQQMDTALKEADYVLGVLTQAYMTSSNCKDEWTNAERDHFIPVLCEDFQPDGLLTSIAYIKLYDKEGEAAVEELRQGLQGIPRPDHEIPFKGKGAAKADEAASHDTLTNLPGQNPYFTGRKKELLDVSKALAAHQTAALVGQGGFGKTQIAQEYAYQHWDEYGVIWKFDASSGTQIEAGYREFARVVLDMPDAPMQSFDAIRPRVDHWLRSHHDYLFLFDNAEGYENLGEYLPRHTPRGHALITSREVVAVQGVHVESVDVDIFKPGDALTFLRNRIGKGIKVDKADGDKLAEALGFLPLALEQAAAYIRQKKYTLPGYMTLLEDKGLEVFAGRSPNPNYEKTVLTTWTITMEQLEPDARELMYMLAHCAPNDIPLHMFAKGHEYLPEALKAALWPEDALKQDVLIEKLQRFALVKLKRDAWNRPLLSVHLLMQGVLRRPNGENVEILARCLMVALVASWYKFDTKENFTAFSQAWKHVTQIAAQAEKQWAEDEDVHKVVASIYHGVGHGLQHKGDYSAALEWHKKALAIREKILGMEHCDTAITYGNLALVSHAQGDYSAALEWNQKALAIFEKIFGKEHRNTAIAYNNLAMVYHALGDYSRAMELYQKALAINEKVLEKEHPDAASVYGNIAMAHHAQGDYSEALKWVQKTLAIRKVLGEEHPSIALTYNNTGGIYCAQENYLEALKWHQNALVISERVLGSEHPFTATMYYNTARIYMKLDKFLDAAPLLKNAYQILLQKRDKDDSFTMKVVDYARCAHTAAKIPTPFEEWIYQPDP
ncbi:MAG: tetratricopeptide repeat protein [Oscillospiraceae bacterium]|jgi:tetratricopeptide (TPR) repeat protein|nr:tetratricopeptide repeat protein [Oscillospiraceae bacterium]